jgi:hypothetical protein
MSGRARRGGEPVRPERRRKQRARPMPRWLKEQQELDEVARRRCLMVLSVLSGETPVTEAVETAKVSRGTYYQLETKALKAMLAALAPGASEEPSAAADGAARRIAALEEQVARLTQEKRRNERLLFLTRKLVKPGPMKGTAGRPPKSRSSARSGSGRSKSSGGTEPAAISSPPSSSTPTTGGAAGP